MILTWVLFYMTNPGYKILVNMKMIIRARAALFRRNKNSISETIVWQIINAWQYSQFMKLFLFEVIICEILFVSYKLSLVWINMNNTLPNYCFWNTILVTSKQSCPCTNNHFHVYENLISWISHINNTHVRIIFTEHWHCLVVRIVLLD